MSLDNLNTNYTHAIACIEQSRKIQNKLDEMGLYSYLVTCKPDKFLSKHGDELMIESHTILVHPCLYNKKLSFVIFDPGFRLKNSVFIIDKENSCDKSFYDGIYRIEYKNNNDYPYEIYTNRRTDINRNIYIKDIHWKFNLYYETINIDNLYYYFMKIMYSYKIVSYSTKYENNVYIIYEVFKDLIIYSDGYNIKEIKITDLKNMSIEEIKKLFSKCIRNIGYDIDYTGMFKDIIDEILGVVKTEKEEKEHRFLATLACKAAVKGNMKLDVQEQINLIDKMVKLENPFTCPHGRPTTIKISKEELLKIDDRG